MKRKPKVGEVWLVRESGYSWGEALVVVKENKIHYKNCLVLDADVKDRLEYARERQFSLDDRGFWAYCNYDFISYVGQY